MEPGWKPDDDPTQALFCVTVPSSSIKKMSLRQNVKDSILAAIQRNTQPKIPKDSIGLVLPVSSGRSRQLVQNDGRTLTPAGRFYYDQIGQEFNPFEVNQPETLRRRTKYMIFFLRKRKSGCSIQQHRLGMEVDEIRPKSLCSKKGLLCYLVAHL